MNEHEYNKGINEGGYGYNPYLADRERTERNERPRSIKTESAQSIDSIYPEAKAEMPTMTKADKEFKRLALTIDLD